MSIELPPIESWPVSVLVKTFAEEDLCEAIAYLEMVRTSEYTPGPEMFNLGISPLEYSNEEIVAVQCRLALAVSRIRQTRGTSRGRTRMTGRVAA